MVTLAGIIPALVDCLEALEEGADELEKRLSKHAKHRQELVALLEIVKELRGMGEEGEPGPSEDFVRDLKAKLLKEFPATSQRGGDEG